MRSVRDIPILENIPVLVRTSMNVPLAGTRVVNDYRLRRALPTIQYLSKRGAKVILISHIGEKGTETLEPAAKRLGKLIPQVSFFPESVGPRVRARIREMAPGDILVLENLRRHRGEAGNSPTFARDLAALADVFVEDAFDTCHRAHASIVGVPKLLPSYAGLLLAEEVAELDRMLAPKSISLAAIGGAKFSTKEAVLAKLLGEYDQVFVGGALANDFLHAAGYKTGKSLLSLAGANKMKKILCNPKLVLPVDCVVTPAEKVGKPSALKSSRVAWLDDIEEGEVILDHGPATSALLASYAKKAKTILWNGPFGKYEDGFTSGTDAFALAVAKSRAYSLVGGGDTVATLETLGLLGDFSFVSTGGGAMLDLLAEGTLPGITVLG